MTLIFKPYRLINNVELQILQASFDKKLQHWNDMHALFPLSLQLNRTLETSEDQHLSVIKYSLFGDQSDCFNTQADTLFTTLLTQLFDTHTAAFSRSPVDDWCYIGSPSLTLALHNAEGSLTLYLNPEWVLSALPTYSITKKATATIQQSLATQRLNLEVALTSLPLKLADIIRLRVGDVIKTDHSLSAPAQLTLQHKTICSVDIGASNACKSIQITRES